MELRGADNAQGYVMRRLVRRAVRFALGLGLEQDLMSAIVPTIVAIYAEPFPEIAARTDEVVAVLTKEENAFRRSLRKGIKKLNGYRRTGLPGAALIVLYDTSGLPSS